MANIELVIKIPEEDYERLKEYKKAPFCSLTSRTYEAIANGVPLPKGHGRLIDADDIAVIDEQFYVPSDYYVAESAIDDAPTIIEKDKEQKE